MPPIGTHEYKMEPYSKNSNILEIKRKIAYHFDLITILTKKEIKVRYKNSILGYMWSIANPLLYAMIFYFVFKIIMRFQIKDYTLFLIAGLFPWQWINNSISGSAGSFIGNASLIKKVTFPRLFLPLSQVLNDIFHFIVSIPVIIIFILFYGKYPSMSWLYIVPLMIIPTFFITYGFALAISSINIVFRDLQYLIALLMTILFYLTPVFYTMKFIPARYRHLVYLNPFTPIITNWRSAFMYGYINWSHYLLSLLYGAIIFVCGYIIYRKLKYKFAEMI